MLRISKLTDYSIVVMTHIASQPSRSLSAAEITAALPIGAPTVSKLLKQLARSGLLVSQRGARGGYALARSADQISVAEVIAAIEGPVALTECSLPGICQMEQRCRIRNNWEKLSGSVYQILAGVSLAEMARPASPPRREAALSL